MKSVLVTQPVAAFGDDIQAIKKYVSEQNAKILLCEEYPTSFSFFNVKTMIGDPNYSLSEHLAQALFEHGILIREPWIDTDGRQAILIIDDQKSLLWHYSWGNENFEVLDEPTLLMVGWDLRTSAGFYNVVVIDDEVKQKKPKPAQEAEASNETFDDTDEIDVESLDSENFD